MPNSARSETQSRDRGFSYGECELGQKGDGWDIEKVTLTEVFFSVKISPCIQANYGNFL